MTGMSAPLPAGAVRIVNGEVVRSSDVETGYGGAPVTPAPSTNTFHWLGGEKHRAYKILAVLVFFVAFGIRAAVPMVLLYILYQVFGVVRSNNESSSFGSFGGGGQLRAQAVVHHDGQDPMLEPLAICQNRLRLLEVEVGANYTGIPRVSIQFQGRCGIGMT